jgi:pyruvate dehydrogenase E1 component alpha subunit
MKAEQLIQFEDAIAEDYKKGLIRNPIHLSGTGNEQELINIFKKIKKNDWVFSTHRNHYHALLKSNNPKWVKEQIYKSSMHINSRKYKFFTSSIVGGCIPIALGVALANRLKGSKDMVYCFIGDMASQMGIFHECIMYSDGRKLPIEYIVENNELGVETPTMYAWGTKWHNLELVKEIDYKRKHPHYGVYDKDGKRAWVNF